MFPDYRNNQTAHTLSYMLSFMLLLSDTVVGTVDQSTAAHNGQAKPNVTVLCQNFTVSVCKRCTLRVPSSNWFYVRFSLYKYVGYLICAC